MGDCFIRSRGNVAWTLGATDLFSAAVCVVAWQQIRGGWVGGQYICIPALVRNNYVNVDVSDFMCSPPWVDLPNARRPTIPEDLSPSAGPPLSPWGYPHASPNVNVYDLAPVWVPPWP